MHMVITMKTLAGMKSQAQVIYEALSKNEISQEEANNHTALLVAETLNDHDPVSYPPISEILTRYLQNRIALNERRDPVLAIKNGEWVQLLIRIRTRNISDFELLIWAGKICKNLGADNATKKLREAVMKHARAYERFPFEDFNKALRVQEMDADERRRGNSDE